MSAAGITLQSQSGKNITLYQGDSLEVLKSMEDNSIDLIVTSPPYSDQRKSTYGGIHPDKYVEWFLPISAELLRVLKPTGSFVLNIKEKVYDGERHTYVIELILALRKQGWLYNVKIPIGDWSKTRLKNLSETDKTRDESKVGSGFGKKIENWVGKDMVLPDNVLYIATESGNKSHSAAFPEGLPEWFIKLFTKEGDIVLDPFLGSGTTCKVALELGRNSIGIELNEEYYKQTEERLRVICEDK